MHDMAMTEVNKIILEMVRKSTVGQTMTPADLQDLETTLETTPAQKVGGWLGLQIREAARLAKGDYIGHPFRGNQWSDSSGASTGGAGASSGDKKYWADTTDAQLEDLMAGNLASDWSGSRQAVAEIKQELHLRQLEREGFSRSEAEEIHLAETKARVKIADRKRQEADVTHDAKRRATEKPIPNPNAQVPSDVAENASRDLDRATTALANAEALFHRQAPSLTPKDREYAADLLKDYEGLLHNAMSMRFVDLVRFQRDGTNFGEEFKNMMNPHSSPLIDSHMLQDAGDRNFGLQDYYTDDIDTEGSDG